MANGGLKVVSPIPTEVDKERVRKVLDKLPTELRELIDRPAQFPLNKTSKDGTKQTGDVIHIVFNSNFHRDMVAEAIDYINKERDVGGKKPLPYEKEYTFGIKFKESALKNAEPSLATSELKAPTTITVEVSEKEEATKSSPAVSVLMPFIPVEGSDRRPTPHVAKESSETTKSIQISIKTEEQIEEMRVRHLKLIKDNAPDKKNADQLVAVAVVITELNEGLLKKTLTKEQFKDLKESVLDSMRSEKYSAKHLDMLMRLTNPNIATR